MNMLFKIKNKLSFLALLCLLSFPLFNYGQGKRGIDWVLAKVLKTGSGHMQLSGSPKLVDCPYGEAVRFNGIDDALFLEHMPLEALKAFTVEMIFKPAIDGDFEQRILHIGEVSNDRMLLEIRAVNKDWYFDGFVSSDQNEKALIAETLTHPLDQWYHVALVVTKRNLTSYVNGQQELTKSFDFKPIKTGRSVIGARLDKRSWFKGDIYRIKISPKALNPKDFMSL